MHNVSLGKIFYKYFAFLNIVRTTIYSAGFQVSRNKDGSTPLGFTSLLRHIPTESFDITTRQGLPRYLLAANMPLRLQLRWFSVLCLLRGKIRQALLNLERPCISHHPWHPWQANVFYVRLERITFNYSEYTEYNRLHFLYRLKSYVFSVFFLINYSWLYI